MVTIDAIWDAAKVLQGTAERTLLVPAERINPAASVYLKLENLQRTGSFKVRGASYKIATLSPQEKERGVIACSAGNHAQGVALAARKEGIKAAICMPDTPVCSGPGASQFVHSKRDRDHLPASLVTLSIYRLHLMT